jgi:hypothetical protein
MKSLILCLLWVFVWKTNFAQTEPPSSIDNDTTQFEYATLVSNDAYNLVVVYDNGEIDYLKFSLADELKNIKDKEPKFNINLSFGALKNKRNYTIILFRMEAFKYLNKKGFKLISVSQNEGQGESFFYFYKPKNSTLKIN